jgi:5S rRNA maturation endonuclease (ribonuclease M5)/archaellum biogenesis ATPase FlaH
MIAEAQLLERFERVHRLRDGDWMVTCPAHKGGQERTPSLHVTRGRDRWLLCCLAGCTFAEVVEAAGLDPRDLSESNGRPAFTDQYTYTDESGKPLFHVFRTEDKSFPQARPDGTWGLGGTRRVLYRLPRVLEAVRDGKVVWVVEGEKDVHSLERLGKVATCNPGGAAKGKSKWKPEYSEVLRGAKVAIVADVDEAGYEHARQVAQSLEGVAAKVRVALPGRGKDITEHLAAGGKLEELKVHEPGGEPPSQPLGGGSLAPLPKTGSFAGENREPRREPPGSPLAPSRYEGRKLDMAALLAEPDTPVPWRCEGIAADGYLTTIAGLGGEGKSWLTLTLADGVQKGRTVIGVPCTQGNAIVFDAENGPKLVVRRFRAAGLGAGSVQPFDADGLHIERDLDWFREQIKVEEANLVIFDSLRNLSSGVDENDTTAMEPIMSALRRLARETGAAIIVVHHRGRDKASDFRGASGIRDGSDLLFKLHRAEGDPEARHRRVLETVKCRIEEEPEPRWFRIETDRGLNRVYVNQTEAFSGDDADDVRLTVAMQLVRELTEYPRTKASLARAIGRDSRDGTVARALNHLVETGWALKVEGGYVKAPTDPRDDVDRATG